MSQLLVSVDGSMFTYHVHFFSHVGSACLVNEGGLPKHRRHSRSRMPFNLKQQRPKASTPWQDQKTGTLQIHQSLYTDVHAESRRVGCLGLTDTVEAESSSGSESNSPRHPDSVAEQVCSPSLEPMG